MMRWLFGSISKSPTSLSKVSSVLKAIPFLVTFLTVPLLIFFFRLVGCSEFYRLSTPSSSSSSSSSSSRSTSCSKKLCKPLFSAIPKISCR